MSWVSLMRRRPFMVAIAVAITALAVTQGMQWRPQALAVAAVLYVLLVWVGTWRRTPPGRPPALAEERTSPGTATARNIDGG
jgi:hypothetical protein